MFNFIKAGAFSVILTPAVYAANPGYPITANEIAGVQNLGPGVNTPDSEYTPYVTPDEKFLFFQSNRTPSVGPGGDFDLWYSMNKPDAKGEPNFEVSANVGLPINSESLDGHPSLRKLPTGEYEMYFSSFASASRQGPLLTNIYYTIWKGGKWLVPQPVAGINTDFHDRMPSISEDGRYLFFSSDRPGGHGSDDIWLSEFNAQTGKWGVPKNAGSVNTAASEVTPSIHSDGITLYFSSNQAGGAGGYDIYFTQSVARLANQEEKDIISKAWTPPLNLGKPFNSEFDDEYPTVMASGERVYFTSNRSEGIGGFDIYRARVPLFARPVTRLSVAGRTLAGGGKRIVAANVQISSGDFSTKTETSAEKNGNYKLNFISGKEYKIVAESKGYRTITETLDARQMHQTQPIQRNFNFIRNLKLTGKTNLTVSFVNAKGEVISPKTRYRILGRDKKYRPLKIKKGSGTIALLSPADFKSEELAIAALEGYTLDVQADYKGYEPLREKKDIATFLDAYDDKVPKSVEVKFRLIRKGEAIQKKPEG